MDSFDWSSVETEPSVAVKQHILEIGPSIFKNVKYAATLTHYTQQSPFDNQRTDTFRKVQQCIRCLESFSDLVKHADVQKIAQKQGACDLNFEVDDFRKQLMDAEKRWNRNRRACWVPVPRSFKSTASDSPIVGVGDVKPLTNVALRLTAQAHLFVQDKKLCWGRRVIIRFANKGTKYHVMGVFIRKSGSDASNVVVLPDGLSKYIEIPKSYVALWTTPSEIKDEKVLNENVDNFLECFSHIIRRVNPLHMYQVREDDSGRLIPNAAARSNSLYLDSLRSIVNKVIKGGRALCVARGSSTTWFGKMDVEAVKSMREAQKELKAANKYLEEALRRLKAEAT